MTDSDRIKLDQPTIKEALYHMTIVMKEQGNTLKHLSDELDKINLQLNDLKKNPNEYLEISTPSRERLKDGAAGGFMGATITALVPALWEVFKSIGK